MNPSKNTSLIIGISIPVLAIAAVFLALYFPTRSVQPKYNFIYSNSNYYAPLNYEVRDGKLVQIDYSNDQIPTPIKPGTKAVPPQLFIYDFATVSSREISFDEAQKLHLTAGPRSPDGYDIVSGSGGGFFPFFYDGSSYRDRYIKNDRASKKLNLQTDYNFRLIGWILPS